MTYIQKIVQREDWQKLRKSLVGTWKKTPYENTLKLRAWLDSPFRGDYYIKVRILLNYLTGSGFRLGIISHPEIDNLLKMLRFQREVFEGNYSIFEEKVIANSLK